MDSKGIIYYSDNTPSPNILKLGQDQLLKTGLPIVSVTLAPMDFGTNIVLPLERGWRTYFTQIYTALLNSTSDIIFFCEHDVLYPKSHFDFTPPTPTKFYYNQNWVKIDWPYTKAVAWDADQVSGLACSRLLALAWYKDRLDTFDEATFKKHFEPASRTEKSVAWRSADPYVDIRQRKAATKSKWSLADFRDKSTAVNFRETVLPAWAHEVLDQL